MSADRVDRLIVRHCRLAVRSIRAQGSGSVGGTAGIDVVLVELVTADGVTGWGEGSPWAVFTGTAEATAAALERYLAPVVVGRRVGDIPAIMADADSVLAGHPEAKAALETALLDAHGKALAAPIWALLGGRARDRLPLSVSLADPDFARDRELVAELRAAGVGIVKLKAGIADHRFDLLRLEWLRSEAPEFDVRVDYNQALQPFEALARLGEVATFQPTFIEQPVAGRHLEAMAALSARLDVPILADESVFTPAQMLDAVARQACGAVSLKTMKSGGLRGCMAVAAIAEAAGVALYGGDMFETGIAHLAGTQMLAATQGDLRLGCEFYQARWFLEHDLLTEPFPIEAGQVIVPSGPGLGITPDPARVEATTLHSVVVR